MQTIHPQLSTAQRMAFHKLFAAWLAQASDGDFLLLDQARHHVAPNQVCSAIKLVQRCQADPALAQQLPPSLTQLLQERNWPQAAFSRAGV